ncbi:hypothetical protein CO005_03255 [Candidatus Roizmanbacteria bacterium CG_4_8_14_3_um_filter_34_9]|uniref:Uncharacterized protein n=1 Tax=Candidatus Roizmanbacteria bacterium CG_4_8_14_3_um_filter_34_9 TaxID=1974832 RepID=A0A2M7IBR6_9BACT|nr:MAG: hypothetical protein CO005_03255 [Candidatus Roizmanbacteria bacterium CG_4_8_14_3_um_filter_34_9]
MGGHIIDFLFVLIYIIYKEMKNINLRQKKNLADFFRETSVAFISVGGFTAVFDKVLSRSEAIYQMFFSVGITIILLIISFWILKK